MDINRLLNNETSSSATAATRRRCPSTLPMLSSAAVAGPRFNTHNSVNTSPTADTASSLSGVSSLCKPSARFLLPNVNLNPPHLPPVTPCVDAPTSQGKSGVPTRPTGSGGGTDISPLPAHALSSRVSITAPRNGGAASVPGSNDTRSGKERVLRCCANCAAKNHIRSTHCARCKAQLRIHSRYRSASNNSDSSPAGISISSAGSLLGSGPTINSGSAAQTSYRGLTHQVQYPGEPMPLSSQQPASPDGAISALPHSRLPSPRDTAWHKSRRDDYAASSALPPPQQHGTPFSQDKHALRSRQTTRMRVAAAPTHCQPETTHGASTFESAQTPYNLQHSHLGGVGESERYAAPPRSDAYASPSPPPHAEHHRNRRGGREGFGSAVVDHQSCAPLPPPAPPPPPLMPLQHPQQASVSGSGHDPYYSSHRDATRGVQEYHHHSQALPTPVPAPSTHAHAPTHSGTDYSFGEGNPSRVRAGRTAGALAGAGQGDGQHGVSTYDSRSLSPRSAAHRGSPPGSGGQGQPVSAAKQQTHTYRGGGSGDEANGRNPSSAERQGPQNSRPSTYHQPMKKRKAGLRVASTNAAAAVEFGDGARRGWCTAGAPEDLSESVVRMRVERVMRPCTVCGAKNHIRSGTCKTCGQHIENLGRQRKKG